MFCAGRAYPDNSIRQIPGVWDKLRFLVMGQRITLNEIEHGILRRQNKDLVEKCGRFYEPFIGDQLDDQLDDQARRLLSNSTKFRIGHNAGSDHRR